MTTEPLVCELCGATDDVGRSREHLGGHGYAEWIQCRDREACWARFDQMYGILTLDEFITHAFGRQQ